MNDKFCEDIRCGYLGKGLKPVCTACGKDRLKLSSMPLGAGISKHPERLRPVEGVGGAFPGMDKTGLLCGVSLTSILPGQKAKGRIRTPGMNKAETAYAVRLEELKTLGEVLWFKYEGMTFKLAHDTRYTPDFAVLLAGGELQMHEVKAFWKKQGKPHFEDDAKAKIRIAADLFPLQFTAVWQNNGIWEKEEF